MVVLLVLVGIVVAVGLGLGLLWLAGYLDDARYASSTLASVQTQYRALSAAAEIREVGYQTQQAMWEEAARTGKWGGTR